MIFNNEDDVTHNIHILGPGADESADLGLQKPGVPLNYRFDKAGRILVRCNIHPAMRMVVTVK
jgi:plastocyanin